MKIALKSFLIIFLVCLACSSPKEKSSLPQSPRLVALTPSLASSVFAVDPQANLVAASVYTTWPEAAALVATLPMPASLERIVRLQPDLVLLHPSDLQLKGKLEKLHIPTLTHEMDTLADIETTLIDIGQTIGKAEAGVKAAEHLKQALDDALPQDLPQERISFLFIIDVLDARMQQLYIAQNHAFLAELSARCGGDALSTGTSNWAQISAETLIRLNPENIIFLTPGVDSPEKRSTRFEMMYPNIKAVQTHHIVFLSDPALSVPDTRLPHTQSILCDAIQTLRDTP